MRFLDRDKKESLPEAPASVTARVVSDHGFHLLFTLRDTSVSSLLAKFEEFQKHILSKGWKPELFGGKKADEDQVFANQISAPKASKPTIKTSPTTCEICGAPATKKSGYRKDGSRWEGVFCSTGDDSHKVWLS